MGLTELRKFFFLEEGKVKLTLAACAAALAIFHACAAQAQDFPVKPIRMVVPFPPGGIGTILMRYLGDQMQARWKQQVIVEYKPGAGTFIALDYVSKAEPDGYTLALLPDSAGTLRYLVKGNSFDPARDLAPVSNLVRSPYVLQTNASVPVKTMREFIDYVKARPGKLNAGVVGSSIGEINTVLFMKRAGIEMAIIPYSGGAPNLTALLANDTQLYFGNYGTSRPHIEAGKLTALAATGAERYFLAPQVPTLRESGVDLTFYFWFALAAPPKTPPAIIAKLSGAAAEIMKAADGVEKMKATGLEALGTTPEELMRTIQADSAAIAEAVKLGGIKPQ